MRGKINNISRDKNSDLGAEEADVAVKLNEQSLKRWLQKDPKRDIKSDAKEEQSCISALSASLL